jgi:hypothetical protein
MAISQSAPPTGARCIPRLKQGHTIQAVEYVPLVDDPTGMVTLSGMPRATEGEAVCTFIEPHRSLRDANRDAAHGGPKDVLSGLRQSQSSRNV